MAPRDLRAMLGSLAPGSRIYLQGGAGECLALQACWPGLEAAPGLRIFSALVPGLNGFDYAVGLPNAKLQTLLLPPALRSGFGEGRVDAWPTSYWGAARYMDGDPFDLAILHASPPRNGSAALGLTADFGPIAWEHARRRVLISNPSLPCPPGEMTVDSDLADAIVELDGPVPMLDPPGEDEASRRIARHVAGLIEDGDTIQIGIGRVPDGVTAALSGHRRLRLYSGAIGDGLIRLAEAGALMPGRVHVVGSVVGSSALHRFVGDHDLLAIVDTRQTHDPRKLAALDRFVSINSALEIDLFGQANLEWRQGRLNGGVGGSPDFARGARAAAHGRSIIALPASVSGRSRIVARLDGRSVSLTAVDIDIVVTEHGAADLRGLTIDERAYALIAIAAPDYRASLEAEWSECRRNI